MRKLILFFTGLLFAIPLTTNADQRFVKLVKEIQPAVVTIITYDKNKKPIGQGSGFFFDKKGHIVTNRQLQVRKRGLQVSNKYLQICNR